MADSLPVQGASEADLRRRFNTGRYYERMQAGEFTAEIMSRGAGLTTISGTTVASEVWRYVDAAGRTVAIVHQYRHHGGELAASGRPDPKLIVEDGVKYVLRK